MAVHFDDARFAMPHQPSPLLNEADVAKLIGMSVPSIRRWRTIGGGPPFVRLGIRRIGYRVEALNAWLDARTRTQHEPHPPAAPAAEQQAG
jgi:predicted DNA-binding transcriptional regulator AlpA